MIDFEALFKISYGLYIVSAGNESSKNGFISNTVFQVTADPPKFAACCSKDNHTAGVIQRAGYFSVSILNQDADSKLIGKFGYKSGRDSNKFEGTNYITSANGTPIVLNNAIAWLECKVVDTYDVGTHLMFIAELVDSDLIDNTGIPLTYAYYRETKKGMAPKNAPTYIDKSKLEQKAETVSNGKSKWKCPACGYIYDPEKGDPDNGVEPGTAFEDIPNDWVCPLCGTAKADFFEINN